MSILLIEDDIEIASFIIKGLRENGFAVDHAIDGEEGLALALGRSYDVLVVDIMLPKRDGFSLIQELREKKPNIPILILSAKRSVEERVYGLQIGSDDYLTKPFAFVELLARIRVLIRRSGSLPNGTRLIVDDLTLDRISHKVSRVDKEIMLNPKEFSILEYLMQHVGEVVTRTMLLEDVWDIHFDPGTNVIDVHVCRLREKVDQGFEHKMIHTIRGVGYVLKTEGS